MPAFIFAKSAPAPKVEPPVAAEVAPVEEQKPAPRRGRSKAAAEDPAAEAEAEDPEPKRVRARHPAGHPKAGHFVADDPATPDVNEAWIEE